MAWLVCLPLLLAAHSAAAQTAGEAELKSAYLYNFTLFTDWPADSFAPGQPLNICYPPASPLREALMRLANKMQHGHRIAVLPAPPDQAVSEHCQVLLLDQPLSGAPPPGILTVSDGEAARASAVITLQLEGDYLRFDVDTDVARQLRLTLSSQLLKLARSVR
jgi:hypothetical protein